MEIDPDDDYRPTNLRHSEPRRIVLPILLFLLPTVIVAYVYRVQIAEFMHQRFGATPTVSEISVGAPRRASDRDRRIMPSVMARRGEASQNLAKLHEFAEPCRFWRARADEKNTEALREAACNKLRDFARSTGFPMPDVGNPHVSALGLVADGPRAARVVVPDCSAIYRYGSIPYRQCRAEIKAWLHRWCLQLAQENNAPGSRPQDRDYARQQAVCSADEQYAIVD